MCEKCPDEEWESEYLSLRFIGGRHLKYPYRGPYLSYETNKIYTVPPEYEQLPYWEVVSASEIIAEAETENEVEPEIAEEETESDIQLPSPGLTKEFSGAPPTEMDFIMGMDDDTLRMYITGQRGKVDGRWGRKKLIEEALKRQ